MIILLNKVTPKKHANFFILQLVCNNTGQTFFHGKEKKKINETFVVKRNEPKRQSKLTLHLP